MTTLSAPTKGGDLTALRGRFPALNEEEAALDNAATTHRPAEVLAALHHGDTEANANVHRAVHRRAREATQAYEGARRRVAQFFEAKPDEVVFTANATAAINLVAWGFVAPRLKSGDCVVTTALEHHSNLVPWQQVCQRTGAELVVLPVDEKGRLLLPDALPSNTCFVAATAVSNAIGTIVETSVILDLAKKADVPLLLDIAQAAGHLPLDDTMREADFLALSAHKMYGPMGVGVLVGRGNRLGETQPLVFGGEMVDRVTEEKATFQSPPHCFEAGTPAVSSVAAFPPALDLLEEFGLATIRSHEKELLTGLIEGVSKIEGVSIVGPGDPEKQSGSVALSLDGRDPAVVATLLDLEGVAVRSGWLCAEPLLRQLGGPVLRASVAAYSTKDEIDRLLAALPGAMEASLL